MKFSIWLENRMLSQQYKDMLKDVPQCLKHHPEGNVLNHVKLVVKSIKTATEKLKELQLKHPFSEILSEINFDLNKTEKKIIKIAAWLHDIGKSTATTVDGEYYKNKSEPYSGKIQAIGHESPEHFLPLIGELKPNAGEELISFYEENKDIIHFLIERHMDFAHGGFSNKFISNYFVNGKIIKDIRTKLLLILMWSDKLGKGKITSLTGNESKLLLASEKSKEKHINKSKQSKSFEGSPEEFRKVLKQKGLSDDNIEKIIKNKYTN